MMSYGPERFREMWKRGCESGKMGEILDLFGKKLEQRVKELNERSTNEN